MLVPNTNERKGLLLSFRQWTTLYEGVVPAFNAFGGCTRVTRVDDDAGVSTWNGIQASDPHLVHLSKTSQPTHLYRRQPPAPGNEGVYRSDMHPVRIGSMIEATAGSGAYLKAFLAG